MPTPTDANTDRARGRHGRAAGLSATIIACLLTSSAVAGGEDAAGSSATTPAPAPSAVPTVREGEVLCFIDGMPFVRWESDDLDQLQFGGVGASGGSVAVFGSEDAGGYMRRAFALYEANIAEGKKLVCATAAPRLNVRKLR